MKFSINDFFSKCDQVQQFPADLVILIEKIVNGKLRFLCSVNMIVSVAWKYSAFMQCVVPA